VKSALIAAVALVGATRGARADDNLTLPARAGGPDRVDAGVFIGEPAALPAGIASGVELGVARADGSAFAYGARLAIAGITESSEAFTASDLDIRGRVTAALRHAIGRGELALRLGAGANVVYEDRTRNGGSRAGLMGSALETHTLGTLPAVDLEAVIALHVYGPWLVVASGGPTADVLHGGVYGGFVAGIAIGWQP
jgi:hypothetical protein